MSRLGSVLTKVENVLAAGSLAAALIAILAVLLRTFFNELLFWSEEAIIYLVICSTFFGAVISCPQRARLRLRDRRVPQGAWQAGDGHHRALCR